MTFPLAVGDRPLFIGRSGEDWHDQRLGGVIDEVAIFDRALLQDEIEAIYFAGKAGMCKPSQARILAPVRSGTIAINDTLRFSGKGTDSQGSDQVQYLWNLGSGRVSGLKDPGLVAFPIAGTNIITLDLTDSLGQHARTPDSRTITVSADTNSIPDLAVTQLNVPDDLAVGQPAQITYTVRNTGDAVLSGTSWTDALYLTRDAFLDVNDRLLISASVSNTVAVGGSYTNTLTATLPAVEEGAYYLLFSVNDEWQFLERHRLNNEFAVATDLVVPRLTNAVPFAAAFTGNGDEHYFRIDVPSGQNLLIRLLGPPGR